MARARASSGAGAHGTLAATWRDGRAEVDRDQEIALELLSKQLGHTLDRLADRAAADPEIVLPLKRG